MINKLVPSMLAMLMLKHVTILYKNFKPFVGQQKWLISMAQKNSAFSSFHKWSNDVLKIVYKISKSVLII